MLHRLEECKKCGYHFDGAWGEGWSLWVYSEIEILVKEKAWELVLVQKEGTLNIEGGIDVDEMKIRTGRENREVRERKWGVRTAVETLGPEIAYSGDVGGKGFCRE